MVLAVTDTRTTFTTNDGTASEWDEGTTSDYTEGQREGTGFVGYDVDIETLYNFNTTVTIPADMSGNHYGGWLQVTNAGDLDTKALGGIQLALRDGAGNESYWYVGGKDTYSGGWVYFVVDLDRTPDANNGADAVLTNALDLGVGFKCLAKTLNDNCQMDLMHYGTGGLIVTGTPDTGTYGTDKAMQELFDLIDAADYGLLDKQVGVFVGKGPIQFNDNVTGACTFNDSGSTLVYADLPVSASFYKLSLGSSTGITAIRFGTVVGSGDDRQGVNGGSIFEAGIVGWGIDFATNLGGNASNRIKLYGVNYTAAKAGISLDDSVKTVAISLGVVNCGELDPGATNNGAEILNFAVIDPLGAVNNYGLKFPQTPSGGILSHNIKKGSFITSGSPTTQFMLNFVDPSDYSVSLDAFKFFGDYSSVTLWHGINSGLNADISINSLNGANPVGTEFSNTNGGTVTVISSFDYELTGLDAGASVTIVDITVPATPVELFNEVAGVDGKVTYSFDGALSGTSIGVYLLNTTIKINEFDDVLPSVSVSFPVNQTPDNVYIP